MARFRPSLGVSCTGLGPAATRAPRHRFKSPRTRASLCREGVQAVPVRVQGGRMKPGGCSLKPWGSGQAFLVVLLWRSYFHYASPSRATPLRQPMTTRKKARRRAMPRAARSPLRQAHRCGRSTDAFDERPRRRPWLLRRAWLLYRPPRPVKPHRLPPMRPRRRLAAGGQWPARSAAQHAWFHASMRP